MPTASASYGLVILMFWKDHNSPYFQALIEPD